MNRYDTSQYDVLVPPKERKALLRFLLFLPVFMLASWGAREINSYEDKMDELLELKNSYIEEIKNPQISENKLEGLKGRISSLETSVKDISPSKGMYMFIGSIMLGALIEPVLKKLKKENQAAHTTPVSAPR